MPDISHIVCAIDLSPRSGGVAAYGLALAKALGSRLTIVHVTPKFNHYMSFAPSSGGVDGLARDKCTAATALLRQFMDSVFAGEQASMAVLQGQPAAMILDFAGKNDTDLIVMGTHGQQRLHRKAFGSVAETVLAQSPVPVLTIRPPR